MNLEESIYMVQKKVTIKNPTGLQLHPAGRLCEEAMKYQAAITFRKGNMTVNAKSLLAVLGACIRFGDEVEFFCDGEDEKEALKAMTHLINHGMDD